MPASSPRRTSQFCQPSLTVSYPAEVNRAERSTLCPPPLRYGGWSDGRSYGGSSACAQCRILRQGSQMQIPA